jgi:hypothetical protein
MKTMKRNEGLTAEGACPEPVEGPINAERKRDVTQSSFDNGIIQNLYSMKQHVFARPLPL